MMVIFYHACLSDEILRAKNEEYLLLEPCQVLTEEEWILRGLTPWIDSVEESNVSLVYVDETQDEEAIVEAVRLEEL